MEIDHLRLRLDVDTGGFRRGLTAAASLLQTAGARIAAEVETANAAVAGFGKGVEERASGLKETLEGVARSLSGAFRKAFDEILRTGDVNLGGLLRGLAGEVAGLGLDAVFNALGARTSGLLGGLVRRAAGGPVAGGTAYLVGERGPELFVPSAPGRIAPTGVPAAPSVTVNIQTTDARSFLESESQVVSVLSRAVVRGQRFRSS